MPIDTALHEEASGGRVDDRDGVSGKGQRCISSWCATATPMTGLMPKRDSPSQWNRSSARALTRSGSTGLLTPARKKDALLDAAIFATTCGSLFARGPRAEPR